MGATMLHRDGLQAKDRTEYRLLSNNFVSLIAEIVLLKWPEKYCEQATGLFTATVYILACQIADCVILI